MRRQRQIIQRLIVIETSQAARRTTRQVRDNFAI